MVVCTYVHMYTCIYVHVYIRTYVPECWPFYLPIHYIHTYVRVYVHTYVRVYVHTYVRVYVHTYVRVYVHTYVRNYLRTLLLEIRFTSKLLFVDEAAGNLVGQLVLSDTLSINGRFQLICNDINATGMVNYIHCIYICTVHIHTYIRTYIHICK